MRASAWAGAPRNPCRGREADGPGHGGLLLAHTETLKEEDPAKFEAHSAKYVAAGIEAEKMEDACVGAQIMEDPEGEEAEKKDITHAREEVRAQSSTDNWMDIFYDVQVKEYMGKLQKEDPARFEALFDMYVAAGIEDEEMEVTGIEDRDKIKEDTEGEEAEKMDITHTHVEVQTQPLTINWMDVFYDVGTEMAEEETQIDADEILGKCVGLLEGARNSWAAAFGVAGRLGARLVGDTLVFQPLVGGSDEDEESFDEEEEESEEDLPFSEEEEDLEEGEEEEDCYSSEAEQEAGYDEGEGG